ncbi:MAG: glycosyltransferase family 4 protein [Vicinamibacterales bacterium]
MPSAAFVVPGPIDTRTGGSIYDRRMAEGLARLGWHITVVELEGAFPQPAVADVERAAAALASIAAGTLVVVDGLALSAMPEVIEHEAARLRVVALVHLPLAADVGFDAGTRAKLAKGEERALAASALIVVTGSTTIGLLEQYALEKGRMVVVEPGTDPAPLAGGSRGPGVHLLCVATVNAGKGHDVLFSAVAAVPNRDWRLTCAGSLTRDTAAADRIRLMAEQLGINDRLTLAGEQDSAALAGCYAAADVFVLATRRETYGMAVAEALAHGLPVVSTTTGAIPDLVGNDAGILVPPGDAAALTRALSRVIGDAGHRAGLAAGARQVRNRLPTWEHAAARMNAALQSLDAHD